MRRSHLLRPNKGCESPHDAIWCDTETIPKIQPDGSERHYLNFGWAAHRRTARRDEWTTPDWLRFTSISQFWEWVESKLHGKTRLFLFAHNWGFDAPVLNVFRELPERGWSLTGSVIESPPVILKWRRGAYTLELIDTLNIWRVPLAKIGEAVGLPKLTMPAFDAPIEEWDIYGKRDTEIIMQACLAWWDFLKRNDLGGFAPTLASQALRTFRHRFMKHEILCDDNTKALSLARHALHGGRTEAYYIGKVPETIYKLDINSMYPAVMATGEMPTKVIGHYNNVALEELSRWVVDYAVCAAVVIATDEPVYPCVEEGRLLFPVGEFISYLSTPELVYALEHGHIRNTIRACVYEKAVIFKDYVEWFYHYRQQQAAAGNTLEAWNTKIMMNSLYGKFGQRGMHYEIIDHTEDLDIHVWSEIDAETGMIYKLRQYGGIVEQLTEEGESRDSHPAIAAHVTAYARMLLWSLQCSVGRENCYYSDTDSLWVNAEGYRRAKPWLDDSRLGFAKLEDTHKDVTIYGAKDYVIDDKRRIKGVRERVYTNPDGSFTQVRFSSLKGLLRTGRLDAPVVELHNKNLKRIYYKGNVGSDGWVSPFRFTLGDATDH